MGTILSALVLGKPLLVMPRRGDLKETRNDHQVATASALSERGVLEFAQTEDELCEKLDQINQLDQPDRIEPLAPPPLIEYLRSFISGDIAETGHQKPPENTTDLTVF